MTKQKKIHNNYFELSKRLCPGRVQTHLDLFKNSLLHDDTITEEKGPAPNLRPSSLNEPLLITVKLA